MKIRLLLATSAEVREGMLYLLGGGWTEIGPQPQPFAISGMIEVAWEETNRRRRLEITIENEDGQPLSVPTPGGEQPFRIETQFDVGRPPGGVPGPVVQYAHCDHGRSAALDTRSTLRREDSDRRRDDGSGRVRCSRNNRNRRSRGNGPGGSRSGSGSRSSRPTIGSYTLQRRANRAVMLAAGRAAARRRG